MNICLRFKNKAHNQAFVSDFSTRIKRKSIKGLIINGCFAAGIIAQQIAKNQPITSRAEGWSLIKVAIALLWIVGIFFISLKLERVKKCHKLIFLLFDIVQCCAALSFIPMSHSAFKEMGDNLALSIGWGAGLQYIAGILLIDSWQIRTAHVFFQSIFYTLNLAFNGQSTYSSYIYLIDSIVMYVLFFYFSEKFTRMEFLEKRKMYEDSEAVKSILDDITEGIVIITRQSKILYMNQPVQKMFRLEQQKTTEELFSRIKIKSMMSSGTSKSPTLLPNEKQFQQVMHRLKRSLSQIIFFLVLGPMLN